jgi:hypothetical protein
MLSGSEFIPSIGDISFFEAFSMRRSFAYAQDDGTYFLFFKTKKVTIKLYG